MNDKKKTNLERIQKVFSSTPTKDMEEKKRKSQEIKELAKRSRIKKLQKQEKD